LFSLFWVDADGGTPPPTSHELVGLTEAALLTKLPANVATSVQTLLGTPLDTLFDEAWSGSQATAQSYIEQAVQAANSEAYGTTVHLPGQGTLRAAIGPVSPALSRWLPPGTTAKQLTLGYFVPGIQFSYSVHDGFAFGIFNFGGNWTDPTYNGSFDGEVEVDIAVPSDPTVPLVINAQFNATNISGGPSNLFAVLNVPTTVLGDLITFQQLPSGQIPDQTVPVTVPNLPQLIDQLSNGFSLAASMGFTQLDVQINTSPGRPAPPGNTVEFDLTHPADPGPQVSAGPLPSLFHPQLGLSAPVVPAGGTVDVTGAYFPAGAATQIPIRWTDTTSGPVTASDVQYGASPAVGVPPPNPQSEHIDRSQAGATYTATGLTPNTVYGFLVRDLDVFGLSATAWSVPASPSPPPNPPWSGIWTFLQTQATDQVELVLSAGPSTLGSVTLTNNGTFFASGLQVPGSVPPGSYTISAQLFGQELASALIQVIGSGETPPPVLQTLDPNTGQAYNGMLLVTPGIQVSLRGLDFTPGPVTLWVDAVGSGTKLETVNATPIANNGAGFSTTIFWPYVAVGPHNIIAVQGAQQPSAPVFSEAAPQ
jgi:hypothetical protein